MRLPGHARRFIARRHSGGTTTTTTTTTTRRRASHSKFFSTTNHACSSPSPLPSSSRHRLRLRLQSFNDRCPPFLRRYTTPLLSAPLAHVASFFILHELTAILPLFGLAGAFHYFDWVPVLGGGMERSVEDADTCVRAGVDGKEQESEAKTTTTATATATATNSLREHVNDDLDEGTRRFSKWLAKRGWIGQEDAGRDAVANTDAKQPWGGKGKRLVIEFATAYAITKILLPLRIIGSVWATPWFARSVLSRTQRRIGQLFKS